MFPKKYTQKGKIIIGIYLISLLTIVIISSSYIFGYVADQPEPVAHTNLDNVDEPIDLANGVEKTEPEDVPEDVPEKIPEDVPEDIPTQNTIDDPIEEQDTEVTEGPERDGNGTYSIEDLKILKEAHINIYFDFQSFAVSDEAKASLESFIDVVKAYPDESIVIEGHADGYPNFMNTAMEVELSSNRVKAVYTIMTANGLDQSKFVTINAGSSNPISVKKEERQKNDYVEIYFRDYVIKNINGK
ncbi:OmpA family protein [Fusibacter sp. 3D3]|uniref:OmpA family protein n=1 Tax=Fusibacter sp. 3D3 TaxID=1048380 RepID=UPI00085330CD|nr:OmpA family protein [Fusibacter sp. 3D3]GAU75775.1 hypothetical protein F3D3_0368 [Fusibacter sp. 3D3]